MFIASMSLLSKFFLSNNLVTIFSDFLSKKYNFLSNNYITMCNSLHLFRDNNSIGIAKYFNGFIIGPYELTDTTVCFCKTCTVSHNGQR